MVFNDFDFVIENEIWTVGIHDNAEDDSMIVVDAFLKSDYESLDNNDDMVEIINQMLIKSKDVLESLLLSYFGFEESEVNEVLADIKED